jgi:type I restriction enzyme S subunit
MVKKGFKKTEIGLIPEDWEEKKLGECLLRNPDYGINAAAVPYNENLPVYLRITDITEDGNYSNKNLVSVNNISSSSYYLKEGDLVFARTGASVGKTYLYNPKDGKLVFAGFLIRVKANEDVLIPYYLKYFTQTKRYWDWIAANSMRTGQPGINGNEYKKLLIPLPPKPEQEAIAKVLSDTDTLIEKLEQLIAKKRNIKTATMQQLLKPKEGWEVKKLGDYLYYEQPTKYIVVDTKYDNHNQTPVLTAGKSFILGYTNEEFGIYKTLPVIIFDDFTTASKYVDFKFKVKSSAMKILKPKPQANLRFIFELMQTIKFDSTDHKRYWISEYQHIEVKVPKSDEQTRIAQILTDMDNEIEALEKKLNKYKMLKQGLMQVLLTGKIRLV